jgi:hypothetical protein
MERANKMSEDLKAILDRLVEIDEADTAYRKIKVHSLQESEVDHGLAMERNELHKKLYSFPPFKK